MTTPSARPSREIDGKGRTVRELLAGRKYSIDYYQREYKWQKKQVAELLDDLAAKFLESHEEGNERSAVADYSHYFLGSIIVSDKDGQKFIIDGQQRLTTLTLLLIFLQHRLEDAEQKGQIADLIFSQQYGKRSFNLDIPERTTCMDALYKGEEFPDPDPPESIANILARFSELDDLFSDELGGAALPYFVDWLVENVHLVEITAYSDEDAYTIFETMNDRGLSLTPADMLKGYLLANITDVDHRSRASGAWKERVQALAEIGKDEDADGIKSWLRSQYAEGIRERKRGATPQDFGLIGTEFHRWVRDHEDRLGLTASAEFARFIERDFAFYGGWYERLRQAAAAEKRQWIRRVVARVTVAPTTIEIGIRSGPLAEILQSDGHLDDSEAPVLPDEPIMVLTVAARLKRMGIEKKLVIGDETKESRANVNTGLHKLIARAHGLQVVFLAGGRPISEMAKEFGVSSSYFTRMLRVSFLAPGITRAILQGRQPVDLTASKLIADTCVPIDWQEQRTRLRLN